MTEFKELKKTEEKRKVMRTDENFFILKGFSTMISLKKPFLKTNSFVIIIST